MNTLLSKICFAFVLLGAPVTLYAAACFQGDTNGDGVIDTACEKNSVSGPSGIEITHPNTGAKSFYSMPSGSSFAINTVQGTDGVAGSEVVVVLAANGNGPSGIRVIHDNGGFQRSYDMPSGSSFAINTVQDTDGVAGGEVIVVLAANGNGPSGIRVIHDNGGFQRSYDMPSGSSFAINTVQDTNGVIGAEIVVVLVANGNGPDSIRVINDRQAVQRPYDMPSGSIFTILAVHDYDGVAGSDICYTTSSRFFLIIDRTGSTTTRSGC